MKFHPKLQVDNKEWEFNDRTGDHGVCSRAMSDVQTQTDCGLKLHWGKPQFWIDS